MAEPAEKQLSMVSFVVHATRGVIRDQKTRRRTMLILLAVAVILLISGSTFLESLLNPREHLIWALFFWLTCMWLTLTALMLAMFDLLMVRWEGRRAERQLREKFSENATPTSPRSRDQE